MLSFLRFDWNFSKYFSVYIIIYPLQSSACVVDLFFCARDYLNGMRRQAIQRPRLWPREGLRRKNHATPKLSSVLIMYCDVPLAGDVDTDIYECTIVIVNVSIIRYVETLFRCHKLFLHHF